MGITRLLTLLREHGQPPAKRTTADYTTTTTGGEADGGGGKSALYVRVLVPSSLPPDR